MNTSFNTLVVSNTVSLLYLFISWFLFLIFTLHFGEGSDELTIISLFHIVTRFPSREFTGQLRIEESFLKCLDILSVKLKYDGKLAEDIFLDWKVSKFKFDKHFSDPNQQAKTHTHNWHGLKIPPPPLLLETFQVPQWESGWDSSPLEWGFLVATKVEVF